MSGTLPHGATAKSDSLIERWLASNDDTIAQIEAEIEKAQDSLVSLHQNANVTFLAALDCEDAAVKEQAVEARQALLGSQHKLDGLTDALHGAQKTHADNKAAAEKSADAKLWRDAEAIARDREVLGEEIEALITTLADKYDHLLKSGADLYDAIPKGDVRLQGSPLTPEIVEMALRLQLVKSGFTWATGWPYGASEIESLSDKVKQGNSSVLSRDVRPGRNSHTARRHQSSSSSSVIRPAR